jgi:YD repeat-containing protein
MLQNKAIGYFLRIEGEIDMRSISVTKARAARRRVGLGLCLIAGLAASAAYAAETVTYKYDALGRLITKSSAGSVNTGKKVTVCFDAAGNRKVYKVAANGTPAVCPSPVPTP